MILPKKKRMMILIGIISGIALIAILALLYITFATDIFKSKEELFDRYILDAIETADNFIIDDFSEDLSNKEYESDANFKINFIKGINTGEEDSSNSFNDLNLKVSSKVDNKNKFDYKLFSLYKGSNQIGKLEYVRDDDIYGIHLPGIRQYMCVKNENLLQLFDEESLTEQQKKYIKDTIPEIKFDLSDFKFTDSEKEQLISTYRKILSENTSKENYLKQNSALITFNKESINVNTYTLSLTKEKYNNLRIKLLEQLEKDEIVLNKIDNIQNKINEIYTLEKDYKQEFVKNIEEEILEIKNNNIGQEEVKISVYVKNGKTIRIHIDDKTIISTIDFIDENSGKSIKISMSKPDIVADSTEIEIKKEIKENENAFNIYYQKMKDQDIKEIKVSLKDTKSSENDINKTYEISYDDGNNKITFNYEDNIEIVDFISKDVNYADNNIILNDLDEETRNKVYKAIEDKGGQQIDLIKRNIQLTDLKDIISVFDPEDNFQIDEIGVSQKDKERFNSQFELYQGDEVKGSDMESLLNIAENNSSKAEIVTKEKDNVEIRISIKEGNTDSEGIQTVREVFEEREYANKKYKVVANYSEDGFVNEIVITYTKQ